MANLKAPTTEQDREFDARVGERIRSARLRARLTQTDVAKAAGITFQQLQKYEKGTNRVAASRLSSIAKTIGVPIASLLEDGDLDHKPEVEGLRQLVRDYSESDPAARRVILELARSFARPQPS